MEAKKTAAGFKKATKWFTKTSIFIFEFESNSERDEVVVSGIIVGHYVEQRMQKEFVLQFALENVLPHVCRLLVSYSCNSVFLEQPIAQQECETPI